MAETEEFSKYERARILGARGLQISMDAPLLIKADEEDLEGMNYDPLKIAEKELDSGVLPISVKRPLPKRSETALDKIKIDDSVPSDDEKIKVEKEEEKNIAQGGEMMDLTTPEDEREEGLGESESVSGDGGDGGDSGELE